MSANSTLRATAEAALLAAVLLFVPACGSNVERVPVVQYTEGVETELVEVSPSEWKIADERVVADSNATRVIARGLNGVVDTFGIDELRETTTDGTGGSYATNSSDTTTQRRERRRSFFGSLLLYGLIGNRLGGFRSGVTPRASAYTTQAAYNRVQNSAGQRLNSTARRTTVTRPTTGRKGFGSGRSGRSYGG